MNRWLPRSAAQMLAGTLLACAAVPAAAQDTQLEGTFGAWALHIDKSSPHLFCFVTSEPKTSSPQAKRDAPRAYISTWPKDGVKSEISFRLGFPMKKKSSGSVRIGAQAFSLFGNADRAFVSGDTEELKLVEAMRKGADLTVVASSERGTEITDTYSLSGLGQALQKLQATCF